VLAAGNEETTKSAMSDSQRIVLTGFSGTGKSTVARLLADRLGWRAIDTDDEIEREFGQTIPDIFQQQGEAVFRAVERRALLAALDQSQVVIATGGGATVDPELWTPGALCRPDVLTIALDADPGVLLDRLRAQQQRDGASVVRPMLATDDPLARSTELKARRQAAYDQALITFVVDRVSADQVATEIATHLNNANITEPTLSLDAPSGRSEIFIAPGVSAQVGALLRERWPKARRAWIVTDESVGRHHRGRVEDLMREAGLDVISRTVPPGESSKSLSVVSALYDWLLGAGIERGDVVVALGGGMIGDLAGFVAATALRGVGLIQMPTSLLAMVDSSVGGKTGVNHAAGKNLIGAFYQPPLVIIDPHFLRTLPPRELVSGWGEVLKHGVIQASTPGGDRADLFTFYERNAGHLAALDDPAITYAIRRNVALKAAVVEADEREAGIRAYLNFGHTLGHAIEAAGYRYLHGEAIAGGMRAETRMGQLLDMVDAPFVRRLDALLERYGLPTGITVDQQRALALINSDKKRAAGRQRWVLPLAAGGVTIRDDVPDTIAATALAAISR
jgi:3-dehydroquinate synthase